MSKTIQEQIEVMTHYLNGGEVEYINFFADSTNEEYYLLENENFCLWDWGSYDYRIKKQKKTITIEKWLHEDGRCIEIEKGKLKVRAGSIIIGSYEVEL